MDRRRGCFDITEMIAIIVLNIILSINPLPDMPILDSSSSTTNKDMMSKIWTNGDTDMS